MSNVFKNFEVVVTVDGFPKTFYINGFNGDGSNENVLAKIYDLPAGSEIVSITDITPA